MRKRQREIKRGCKSEKERVGEEEREENEKEIKTEPQTERV